MLLTEKFSLDEHGEPARAEQRWPCYHSETAMEQVRESDHDPARLLGRVTVRLLSSSAHHKVGGVPVTVLRGVQAPGKF